MHTAVHPLYSTIEFPEYEFREFPKWVEREGGNPLLVHNEDEERVALGGGDVVRPEEQRMSLVEQAKTLNVLVDKRWGADRLRKAIEVAGGTPVA